MIDYEARLELQIIKDEIRRTNQLLQNLKDFAEKMFEKKVIDDDVLS